MVIEIRGKHVRVQVRRPVKGATYRMHDVGTPGHTKRVAMRHPRTKRWRTQTWLFPVADVRKRRASTMTLLTKLGVKTKVLKLVGRK